MRLRSFLPLLLLFLLGTGVRAQDAVIRGNVFDEATGEPISFGTVQLTGPGELNRGANTDVDGFFSFAGLPVGDYVLTASYVGYDPTERPINIGTDNEIEYVRVNINPTGLELQTVSVSARRERARSDVAVAKVTFSSDEIMAVPATGGEPDIAQYLTVLPGVVSTGDQGGQLYIRGGSPVQNKLLLDGLTIYNPFHSIGLFSVFETEAIRSADVYTGGFNAEYGGRISAIVDIRTKEGDKKRFSGLVSASPFQAKVLVEGPIKKLNPETGGSISYLLTGKRALLPETSKSLYGYAVQDNFFNLDDETEPGDVGLPYDYQDLYGKISFVGGNGSKANVFGFNFTDDFLVPGLADLNWTNNGGGVSFILVPPNSNLVIDGIAGASSYEVELSEMGSRPRSSQITNITAALNFTYFGGTNEISYGFDYNGVNTNFRFINPLNVTFGQENFTTELNAYAKWKKTLGNLILEPGFRIQYYASLNSFSPEPRLGLKYNATPTLRFKAAGGLYSQNLISTQNDLDIVNFFQGLIVGPESQILDGDGEATDDNLQKAVHGIAGVEFDATDRITFNLEGYYKGFTQLIELNRNKLVATDPDFIALTGDAYGGDLSVEYRNNNGLLLAGNYSLGWVTRDDGEEEFPTSFDRRHNVNAYGSYVFGAENQYQFGFRFNFGSAFPFTQTQGFIEDPNIGDNPVQPDILTGNGDLGILLSQQRNGGRLSDFHRLDLSLQRTFDFGEYTRLEVTASVTNAYNRENIFYVDRISNERVNQLPILPSVSGTFYW